jgi:hypothetical protein
MFILLAADRTTVYRYASSMSRLVLTMKSLWHPGNIRHVRITWQSIIARQKGYLHLVIAGKRVDNVRFVLTMKSLWQTGILRHVRITWQPIIVRKNGYWNLVIAAKRVDNARPARQGTWLYAKISMAVVSNGQTTTTLMVALKRVQIGMDVTCLNMQSLVVTKQNV